LQTRDIRLDELGDTPPDRTSQIVRQQLQHRNPIRGFPGISFELLEQRLDRRERNFSQL